MTVALLLPAVIVLESFLPSLAVRLAIAGALVAVAGLMAYFVSSPRTQWIVPTVFEAPPRDRRIALTFDDGPDPEFTPRILDLLRAHGAQATFFVVGRRVAAHPDVVRRMRDEGHQLGSHSHSHTARFHFLDPRRMAAEIQGGIDAVVQATGVQPSAFRPPLGLRVPMLRRALARLTAPVTCVTWTRRGLDTGHRTPAAIVARLQPHLVDGAILCLHDGAGFGGSSDREPTIRALELLLPEIARRGLRCVRVDGLGASCGPARAQLPSPAREPNLAL